jgi:hypothetical protein
MASSTSRPDSDSARDPRRTLTLWVGVLAGPLLFLTLLEVNYVLAYVACEAQQSWFLHVTGVVAVLLTAIAGLLAWQARLPIDADQAELSGPPVVYAPFTRVYWMATLAALSSVWFIVAMLALAVPPIVLQPCQ